MKIKQLTFKEFNLDGSMGSNYARSISCMAGDLEVFTINYESRGKDSYYWIQEKFFPMSVYAPFPEKLEVIDEYIRIEIKDKEEAKQKAQELFEIYVNLLVDND